MSDQLSLSVLIAGKDEGATIKDVVISHIQVLSDYGDRLNWEIGVLDDGSTDQTPHVLHLLQQSFPNLQVWRNESPSGIASAFAQLARQASQDWIYITSGDGQFDHSKYGRNARYFKRIPTSNDPSQKGFLNVRNEKQ